MTNPFKIRSQLAQATTHATNGALFQLGFWTNTTGALIQFEVPAAGICWYLPYQLWGILSFGVLDLAATVALRRVIWTGMRRRPPVHDSD